MAELPDGSDVELFDSDSDGREMSQEIGLQNESESTLGPYPLREPDIIPTPPRWYQEDREHANTLEDHKHTPGSISDQDLPHPVKKLRDKLSEKEKKTGFVFKARKSRVRRRYNLSDTNSDSDAEDDMPSKSTPKRVQKDLDVQSTISEMKNLLETLCKKVDRTERALKELQETR